MSEREQITLECGHKRIVSEISIEMFYAFDCKECGLINQMPVIIEVLE